MQINVLHFTSLALFCLLVVSCKMTSLTGKCSIINSSVWPWQSLFSSNIYSASHLLIFKKEKTEGEGMVVVSHLQRSFVTGSQQLLHKNTCKTPCWQTLVSLRRIMTFHVTSINKSAISLSVATTEILMI